MIAGGIDWITSHVLKLFDKDKESVFERFLEVRCNDLELMSSILLSSRESFASIEQMMILMTSSGLVNHVGFDSDFRKRVKDTFYVFDSNSELVEHTEMLCHDFV